ncbi:hypothetical protein JHK87_014766 [Glycine soja]|nr:hypothetical protein JHK87_014766 [Glycine soja]
MHRFNIATELTDRCKTEGELGLIGILVWMRFMACRHLTWNKNFNIVKGLGETLVGAYPGRATTFIMKKTNLKYPVVTSYPSKLMRLYSKKSIIFRSDSNAEDLEGFAGAGLFDSVIMDKVEKVVLDYSKDPIIADKPFQTSLLRIAKAGKNLEDLYGCPQDIEGVVKDGTIFVVQARP